MKTVAAQPHPGRRVRVWFGSHAIADLTTTPEAAKDYEAAMRRRFAGLKVTNEPAPPPLAQS
jgi:hypothetical protein